MLWVAQVTYETAFSFALPFVPLFINQELGVSDPREAGLWAGAMAGGFSVAMATLGPVWGSLADRFGRKLMIQRVMFGACVVIGSMSLVQSPQQLLVLRVIQGGLTGLVAALTTFVSLIVPQRRLASTLGLMQAALFTGGTLGPLLGGVFADRFGYRAAFAATSVVFVASGLLVTIFVREPARDDPHPSSLPEGEGVAKPLPLGEAGEGARSGGEEARRGPAPGRRAGDGRLIGPELLAVIFLSVAIRFANNAPLPLLPLFVQQLDDDRTHVGATVGAVVAATGVASMVSALLVGRLADRFGRWATLLVCLLAATGLAPLHAAASTVWQLLIVRTLMGLALGGMTPSLQAVLTDVTPPSRRGAAFGWLATAGAIGNGGGPMAGSAIAAAFGIPAVFVATAPMFLLGAVVLARLPRVSGGTAPAGDEPLPYGVSTSRRA